MVMYSKKSIIKKTEWPESCPKPEEEFFISIGCGNSTINWSLHNNLSSNSDVHQIEIQPKISWTTPHIMEEDDDINPPIFLTTLLPRKLQEFFFGKDSTDFTVEIAKAVSKRRGSNITFYIVSSNDEQTERIGRLLSCVPCRAFLMTGEDFYPRSWGRYEGMGVDRCACLKGSVTVHGPPLLVIDGGSAMTYTAVDSKGAIMGGGISPGLNSKFKSMSQDTGALPALDVNDVMKMIDDSIKQETPIPIFSKNTKEAMIAAVLNEISAHCQNVIKSFEQKIAKANNTNGEKMSNGKVVVTGGSGEIIAALLSKEPTQILESCENSTNNMKIIWEKPLLHLGVGATLQEQINKKHKNGTQEGIPSLEKFIGTRVAKYFDQPCPDDNDHVYRGTVQKIKQSDKFGPIYYIHYDDDDREEVYEEDFEKMAKLYDEVGEKIKQNDQFVGKRVAKLFNEQLYEGSVLKFDGNYFHIAYDDGDEEEFDMNDLEQGMKLHQEKFPEME